MNNYLGIEIGGTKIQLFVGDQNAKIIEKHRFAVEKEKGADKILEGIRNIYNHVKTKYKLKAIGLGFGGPVDRNAACIVTSHHIKGWDGFNISQWLSKLSGLPAFIENDANTAALAEAHLGAGKGLSRVFYVTLGSGMGGGMIVDGKIYHGAVPGEAEIGQMPYSSNGDNFESHCSGWALDRKIKNYTQKHPDSPLAVLIAGKKEAPASQIMNAISAGDKGAKKIFSDFINDLGFALAIVSHLFHPEMIIIGGGLSKIGEPLQNNVEKKLRSLMTDALKPGPRIRLAGLGEDVVPVGAILLAINGNNSEKT